MTISSYQLRTVSAAVRERESGGGKLTIIIIIHYLHIEAEGKFASASTISSPCPIRAKTVRREGERILGIPFSITIFLHL